MKIKFKEEIEEEEIQIMDNSFQKPVAPELPSNELLELSYQSKNVSHRQLIKK